MNSSILGKNDYIGENDVPPVAWFLHRMVLLKIDKTGFERLSGLDRFLDYSWFGLDRFLCTVNYLIIFFIFFNRLFSTIFLYLVVGVIIQIFVKKASGKDRLPNYTVWSSIPGLIKVWSLQLWYIYMNDCIYLFRKPDDHLPAGIDNSIIYNKE